ncbi:ESPR-type extended signal peptide-containing protein [Mitsuokella jalaludinii]|uniref:ESPR-type extended signal peptide-containing protein n=1 Tax=Mitsuokella jalaludinii TaxID=187979 RepID=UPI00299F62A2|nr:ESPR-type extended signal peptide-containing protein [Mitsuokella jalaludinii]
MNKVFKVIWSEARNAYVVVSEIAKNHGSKSCSTKKLLAMLIATGVMTCASVAPVMAANLAPDDYQIEAGNGASASGQGSVAIGNKAQASGLVGIAIGRDAVAKGDDSIAIGSQTQANQMYSVAIGNDISYIGYSSTAVGQQAYATGDVSTAIGTMTNVDADYNKTHADWRKAGYQSTAIGAYSGSWGIASTALGGYSRADEKFATAVGYGSHATAERATTLGAKAEANAYESVAIGAFSVADREAEAGVVGAFAPEGADGLTWKAKAGAVSVGSDTITRQITNVAAGSEATDAVNVAQLRAATENAGWNLATNGVATEATNVKPGDVVDFSGDKNISVSHDGTKVKVELNKNIDVNYVQTNALNAKYNLSVGTVNENGIMPFFVNSNGAFYGANNNFSVDKDGKVTATEGKIGNVVLKNGVLYKNTALRDGELYVGDADGNYSQITPKSAKLGQVTIDEKGNMAGVNSIQTNALNAKYNLSVGTANENGTVPFFVNSNGAFYAANGKLVVDKDGKVTATEGEIGNVVLKNGVLYKNTALRDGELYVGDASGNYSQITTKGAKLGKVTVAADGKISGVAAGAVTADSTDAVNGSQLHAVATEAGKHSKVVSGNNINVEETDVDGQKFYKVNMNKDIMLGDLTGKNVSISGTNGTIEATGAIATKDRVYADKGAKLADIDVTGNEISNGASSIVLDGSNVKVNDKVTIDQDGKISGVAAGEVSKTSTDAINGSQLNQTNENVAALDKRVTQNEEDIAQNKADIAQNKADIAQNKADIAQNKTDIKNLDNRVTNVEELAKKHTTVTAGDNIAVTESTNKDGGKEYKVALDKDINLDSVTTGQIVMNNDGLKVGKDVSVTATAVTAGKTSISDEGVKVGDKTYISDKGLNANDQKVTNVAAGELSATSKDAVNGSQLYETNQAIANNATNISSLSHSISNLDNRVNKVGAGAAALAALHPLDFDPDAKWDFAAGYGNYRGANAAAVGAYYRPNEDTMFSVGGTFGNGENMVNAGVSFKLGSGSSHVSTSRVAMAKEIKELRGELEAMKSAMLDANAGKKIDTSKLQLFPDVPQNHWAYEYVAQLAGNGMIEGYPDGNFAGDRPMTRYEFAAILYRAMTKGAVLSDKILSEFSHELEYFTVDTIAKDKAGNPTIQRVRTVKENKNK